MEERPEDEHPKVRLDTPGDLRYIHEQLQKVARANVEQHFPGQPANERDGTYRMKIQQYVDDYVLKVLQYASHSISINGHDVDVKNLDAILKGEEEQDDMEPYDDSLREQVQNLQKEIEAATLDLSKMRRDIPAKFAEDFTQRFREEIAADNDLVQQAPRGTEAESAVQAELAVHRLPRQNDIEKNWEETVEKLAVQKDQLPKTIHTVSRAQDAVEYINSKTATS